MRKILPATRQRGMTLIESLVALVVAVVGILGIVGMQMRTLVDTQTAVRRAQAVRLIEDLSERLRANPNALISIQNNLNAYSLAFGATPGFNVDCTDEQCSNAQMTAYDLSRWRQTVGEALPLGDAAIFLAPGESATGSNNRQLGVMIAWRENEKVSDDDKNDSSTYRGAVNASLDTAVAAANQCQPGFTCHLQYIAVAGRCIPQVSGGNAQNYCAGV